MKSPVPFGPYLLLDRINVGGMAEVYRAKRQGAEGFERLVAIKRILPSIAEDDEFITMFVDEAKLVVQLVHANIAQVYELLKIEGTYSIVMEYVSGKDLRSIYNKLQKRKEIAPVAVTCGIIAQAAEGLDYAHKKRDPMGRELNLVHRDVSPQNILVSYDGEVKVIDFGVARASTRATRTQAGMLKGKFAYMSPEQVRGLPIDHRSDQFALGVVLFEVLTGQRLFAADSEFSTLEKVRRVDVPLPSSLNPAVAGTLERIVLKALARDPEDRFPSTHDFAEALNRFLVESGARITRKDLAAFMGGLFPQEREQERQFMARALSGAPVEADAEDIAQAAELLAEASGERARPLKRPLKTDDDSAGQDDPTQVNVERGLTDEAETMRTPTPATPPAVPLAPAEEPRAPGEPESSSPKWEAAGERAAKRWGKPADPWADPPALPDTLPSALPGKGGPSHPPPLPKHVSGTAPEPAAAPVVAPGTAQSPAGLLEEIGKESAGGRRPWRAIMLGLLALLLLGLGALAAAWIALRPTTGTLAVRTTPPGAEVLLDGRPVPGTTPLEIPGVQAGVRRVEARLPGVPAVAVDAEVAAGARSEIALAFAAAAVTVLTHPPDALVRLDGHVVKDGGPAPWSGYAAAGAHRIRAERAGFTPEEGAVMLAAGDAATVTLRLRAAPASLVVRSTPPGARVELNGEPRGQTPATFLDLDPAQPHRLLLTLECHAPYEKTIALGAGQEQVLEVALSPAPDCLRRAALRPALAASGKPGFLRLLAKPPAEVLVDGVAIGKTPLVDHALAPGTHRVELVAGKARKTLTISVESGKTVSRIETVP